MKKANFFPVYNASSHPDTVYLLIEGSVYFYVSESDKYAVRGNNLLIGCSEVILNTIAGMQIGRLETAVIDATTKIKKMAADKFISSLTNYSVAVNASIVMAKQVSLTNQIINKNIGSLEGEEKRYKEIAGEYYRILAFLMKENDKRRLPWLGTHINRFATNLLYKRGEAFEKTAEPTRITTPINLSDTTIEFPRDAVICEEGTVGEEMFILQAGAVDVMLRGTRITTISDSGYVFGEMALLLGEPRSATLTAKNNVVMTRLRKNDLREISSHNGDVLLSLVVSLAKKHFYNIQKILSLNNLIIEQTLASSDGATQKPYDVHKSLTELLSLKKETTALRNSKDAEFLQELVEKF